MTKSLILHGVPHPDFSKLKTQMSFSWFRVRWMNLEAQPWWFTQSEKAISEPDKNLGLHYPRDYPPRLHSTCRKFSFPKFLQPGKCSRITLAVQFSSVSQSCPTLRPHGLQHARLPYPSPTPRAYSNSSIASVMPSNHLILFCPLLLPPSNFLSIRVFSSESLLHIR